MSAADTRTPVTVLTGFLGSGKTTTLARLLKAPEFAGTVAIINEFGEIGLDHLLIETSAERYALLDNGCICCTVRDDLVETLIGLSERARCGRLPEFARVVIETTGLADPAPILHSLMASPDISVCYAIDGVLTTIDAVNGLVTLEAHGQAVKQAAVADRLLLTKTDLVNERRVATLSDALRAINPTAQILNCIDGEAPPATLVGAALESAARDARSIVNWFEREGAASQGPRFCVEAHDAACASVACADPRHQLKHREHVTTFSIVIDDPVRWGPFKQWLDYLAMLKGEDLLRFKGLVHVAEQPERPIVLHGVQHVFHPPRELEAWPGADRRTRLVFITRGISRALIESTLSKFAAIEGAGMRRPSALAFRGRGVRLA